MIDKSKTYRTRDDREVRIYATDGVNGAIHGAVLNIVGWQTLWWTSDGKYHCGDSDHDLIEVRPRHKRTVWVNAYKECMGMHLSKERADASALEGRIACIKVDLDFEEREGL